MNLPSPDTSLPADLANPNGEAEDIYVFPASFTQRRLWFLDQYEPDSPFYNIPLAIRIEGSLNRAALEQSVAELVRRHETLRTTFANQDGEPVQVIWPEKPVPLQVEQVRGGSEAERLAEVQQRIAEESRRPFQLARGPLLRVFLMGLGGADQVLLFVMHHIISDGWSIGVLFQEITALYSAFAEGKSSPLPDLPLQYADYAQWQQETLTGVAMQTHLDYWKQQLAGDLPLLELPTDHPRAAARTPGGGTESIQIPSALAQGLRALGRRQECTLFMVLLAAFDTLLYRYTGQEDLCVGAPIANRTRAELEALIGLFVNTLVLRADLSGEPTFRELLMRVRELTLAAYAHQDLPFDHVLEALHPERDTSYNPLFQVMFILQNAPVKALNLPDGSLTVLEPETGTATFDLTLSMVERGDGLEAAVEYSTDLFEAATIRRMLGHFQNLLAAIAANPDESIRRLELLSEAEKRRILIEWNRTRVDYPLAGETIQALFEAQAVRTPYSLAVVWPGADLTPGEGERLTYAGLNIRANQLAHHLRKLGVGPDYPVAICLERSVDTVVAVLGVLKAGGAYLPLDPASPADRLSFMLADSGAAVLLSHSSLRSQMPDYPGCILWLDEAGEELAGESRENPAPVAAAENLAYLIYTSGSTGKPKGVAVRQRNLVNAALAWIQAYDLAGVTAHLQMANFAFDVFSGDLVRALLTGGKLVLCPREALLDPQALYRLMLAEQVDCAEFVPAVLRSLTGYLEETHQSLGFMRRLICGSDIWTMGEFEQVHRLCGPQTRLINSYGVTEATIDSAYFENPRSDLPADQIVPIGRPFPNTRLYVLDSARQPAPTGVAGELYIGGEGVAAGYLHRPELTEDRFVPSPISNPELNSEGTAARDRLYKTGDLVRCLPDGNIEFIGRADDQVKIRGFRVELGEVEAALKGCPGLSGAAVAAREQTAGVKRLVAYVVPSSEEKPDPEALRAYLQDRLPDYMIPSLFISLASLPLTANGKVDRKGLPAPDWSDRAWMEEFIPPRSATEEILAAIWKELLGAAQVGAGDTFFELGGHSLLATQLVSRIHTAFQIDLPLRAVFEQPTLAGMAERIERTRRSGAGVPAAPILPVSHEGDLPLSFAQQRLWFLDQLEPDSPFYNLSETIRITGPIDPPLLEKCIQEVVRRHEILRTTFQTVDGRAQQRIDPQPHLDLALTDLTHLPAAEREVEITRAATGDTQTPFDLSAGPLLRARLLQLSASEHVLLLTMHHIIWDGWSTNVLVSEISRLYQSFADGKPSPLPDLAIQYADFAVWQRDWLSGSVLENQLDYWKKALAGSPALLELPLDRPRPAVQSYRGSYRTFALSPDLSRSIAHLAQKEGATLFMSLLAAFQALLFRYTGQDDFNIGTPIANRNRAELEPLIGFFVNTLVLRANLSGSPGFRTLLARVRETALGAYDHQDLPFEMLVDALQPVRDLSHSPLFQVMFVIQNAPLAAEDLPGVTLSPIDVHSGTAKFDLTLFMVEDGDALSGAFEYNTDLFDDRTIERMIVHLENLLAGATADPDQSIATLPMLTEAERRQLLLDWNDTRAPYPDSLCAHQLIEAQVARTPDAIAASYLQNSISYADLNRRANQVAHHLRRLGVGPEQLVGVCLERSLELLVALLGVLKSGAAYVPLDPTYPPERLAFMIADCRAPVVLTQKRWLADLASIQEESPGVKIVALDADWPALAAESVENPACTATPDNLAYVIYTSGSTGKPKGAMILHRGLVNYLTWCQQAYPLDRGQGSPVQSSISFDLTVTSLFSPLLAGRRVLLLPEEPGAEALGAALQQEGDFSLVKITPAHLQLLGEQISPASAADRTRAFIIGGENLLADHIAFWQTHAPDTQYVNEYGPTETVVGCCVYWAAPGRHTAGVIPIGRPIINTRLYVLDAARQPVPIGVPGELYIGGVGVARGYLNRPELTAERFLPDPFSPEPAARMYRTGDRVRYLADGNLECLGRIDFQVKIRGFRVELGEIEAVLGEHPQVQESVVWVREEGGTKRLVAYVVPVDDQQPPAIERLRDFLHAHLPEYMLPASYVFLPALPLTPNGKVDRKALPAPEILSSGAGDEAALPRSPAEARLAEIWSQALGIPSVGIHANFFELGGDSILSLQILSRANQAGLHFTLRQFFENPTVAGLAQVAGSTRQVHADQGLVTGAVPLTPVQRWFFEKDLPAPNHWNQAMLWEVDERLDPELTKEASRQILIHHDVLRTRFARTDAGWTQVIAEPVGDVPFSWIDLTPLPEAERIDALQAEAERLQASLDLTAGPLFRAAVFDLGGGRPLRLWMALHHLVSDGVTWRILMEDLLAAYQQQAESRSVLLPLKTTSYQRWAQALEEFAQTEPVLREVPYWLSLAAPPLASIPLDFADGKNDEGSARAVTLALSPEETDAWMHAQSGADVPETEAALLAALALAFSDWIGGESLLIAMERHGREEVLEGLDLSRTVGWFTSIFPFRLDLSMPGDANQMLVKICADLARIPGHGMGYGLLRYLCQDDGVRKTLPSIPHPEVSFNYLGQFPAGVTAGLTIHAAQEDRGADRAPQGPRSALIEIDGGIAGGCLQLEWTYSAALHRRETIERVAASALDHLRELILGGRPKPANVLKPMDLSEFGWDQEQLDDILAEIGRSTRPDPNVQPEGEVVTK